MLPSHRQESPSPSERGGHDIQLHSQPGVAHPPPKASNLTLEALLFCLLKKKKNIFNLPLPIMKVAQNLLALLAIASVPAIVAAPVPADENQLAERADYGKYGSYGSYPVPKGGYGSYGSYPEPAGGYGKYGKYGTYGSYKRAIDFVKRIWS
jgi:hypothetical protein